MFVFRFGSGLFDTLPTPILFSLDETHDVSRGTKVLRLFLKKKKYLELATYFAHVNVLDARCPRFDVFGGFEGMLTSSTLLPYTVPRVEPAPRFTRTMYVVD